MLEWSLQGRSRDYIAENSHPKTYRIRAPELLDFPQKNGYFSVESPIVGRVTTDPKDVEAGAQLLAAVGKHLKDPQLRAIATAEVLSKVMAYRDLKKGMEILVPSLIPNSSSTLHTYVVDDIFDLWGGMPAFALVPQDPTWHHSILLFRGTDFSLGSGRGWASLMSDVDTKGPGLKAFRNAQPKLHAWLQRQADQNRKAQAIGYSLGGVLATYTAIYEGSLLHDEPMIAFNPPGISAEVNDEAERLNIPKEDIHIYVTQGDIVSKVGKLYGQAFEFSTDQEFRPITAHVDVLCCEPKFYLAEINLFAENQSRE